MASSISKKIRRYKGLVNSIQNWPEYLYSKVFLSDQYFTFKLKDSFEIEVHRKMISPFKEVFFDHAYWFQIPVETNHWQNPVVVDIGANIGYFSLFVLSRFPDAKVLAYEPMPFNHQVLKKYQGQFANYDFNIHQKAVSNHNAGLTLNASQLHGFTTMSGKYGDHKRFHQIEVPTTTLNDIFRDYQLTCIDYLKLDCEGSEYDILYATSKENLSKIHLMRIEVHPGEKDYENANALASFLRSHGFFLNISDAGPLSYIWAWKTQKG